MQLAVANYMEYAKERARWWIAKHPYLRDDIMATAMLSLVKACRIKNVRTPCGLISAIIDNDVTDLLDATHLIHIPRSELRRRKKAKDPESLPRVLFVDDKDLAFLRQHEPAPWVRLHITDVLKLLRLTKHEQRLLGLRLHGYSFSEISNYLQRSKSSLYESLENIRGRYLRLLHTYRGVMRP